MARASRRASPKKARKVPASTRARVGGARPAPARKGTTSRRTSWLGNAERSAQLLRIADEHWFGLLFLAEKASTEQKPVALGEIQDAALEGFLNRHRGEPYGSYLAAAKNTAAPLRSFWIDSRLLERAGVMAKRDDVSRNRVLYTAFLDHLKRQSVTLTPAEIERLKREKFEISSRGHRAARGR